MNRLGRGALAATILAIALPAAGVAGGPCARAAAAQGTHRAGLVVHAPDRVREFCVAFEEDAITGFELLRRSGLDLSFKAYPGQGVAVCRIAGVGCAHPRQDCFCRDETWSYFSLDPEGGWTVSQIGADRRVVRNGDVDGWRWGATTPSAAGTSPAASDLDGICRRGVRVAAGTPAPAPPGGGSAGLAGAGVLAAAIAGLAALGWRRRRARPAASP